MSNIAGPALGATPPVVCRTEQAPPDLMKNRSFVVLLVGQGVSTLGDAVTMTAVPLLVAQVTGSGTKMGLVEALQIAPIVAFGLFAGSLADRWDRRRIMLFSDVGRALLMGLVPLSALLALPALPVVLAVIVPIAILRSMFMAAYRAIIPSLVRPDQLGSATSALQATQTLGLIAGPLLAGSLSSLIGTSATLAVDAFSFVVSAGMIMLVGKPPPLTTRTARPMLRDIGEGLRFALNNPKTRIISAILVFDSFIGAPLRAALTLHALRNGMTPSTLGALFSAGGVGAVLGYLLGGVASRRRPGLVITAALAASGLVNMLVGTFTSPPSLIAAVFAYYMLNACLVNLSLTLRLASTPASLQGRVGSTVSVIDMTALGLGTMIGGMLIDLTSGATVVRSVGALYLAGSALFALSRTLREASVAPVPLDPSPAR